MPFDAKPRRQRNLILVTEPGRQDPQDFGEIASRVAALDQSIRVFIVSPQDTGDFLNGQDWRYPTLTVTLGSLGRFMPKRGRVLFNRIVSKLRQYELFVEMGVRTPRTIAYRADKKFDATGWGPVVVFKPDDVKSSSRGKTAVLVKTQRLCDPQTLSEELRRKAGTLPMLVQEYIPTGARVVCYRAGTFLGKVIHLLKKTGIASVPDIGDAHIEDAVIDSNSEQTDEGRFASRELMRDEAIMKLARKVAAGFPGIPLLGIDILRHSTTGEDYVLEINGGGNTWQFSSDYSAGGRMVIGKDERVRQFDAWDTCARALVAKTRKLAN